jgi:hypothetical protein
MSSSRCPCGQLSMMCVVVRPSAKPASPWWCFADAPVQGWSRARSVARMQTSAVRKPFSWGSRERVSTRDRTNVSQRAARESAHFRRVFWSVQRGQAAGWLCVGRSEARRKRTRQDGGSDFILLRLPGQGAQSGLALGAPLYRQKLLGEEKGPRCSHAPAFSHTQIHPLCTGCSRLHPYALRPRTCYRGRISDSNEDGTAAAMQRCSDAVRWQR